MPTQTERLSIVETKVHHIDEKLDNIKSDVKDMHDCLDNTRDGFNERLDKMLEEYRTSRDKFYAHADNLHQDGKRDHDAIHKKISELEQFKMKWTYMVLGGFAVIGWLTGHLDKILGFLK